MTFRSRYRVLISLVLACLAMQPAIAPAAAQESSRTPGVVEAGGAAEATMADLTRPYPDSLCSSCAGWNEPQEPFHIHANSYYVGTHGLSAVLITSPEGHILIDGGLPDSAPLILDNIRTLGFRPEDVELILNSHTHYDHAGGIAALQRATGARVAASPESADDLERGRGGPDDPQYGLLLDYPPIETVERFEPGDSLSVGSLTIASHATAGHTPGGTSWSWTACEKGVCLGIVYADSQTPVSADDFRYSDSEAYPDVLADFEHGFSVLESLSCDVLVTTHPSASSLWERRSTGLVDPEACRRYVSAARDQLEKRLEREGR